MNLFLITCIVQRGKADAVVKEALKDGATGATIYYARGRGVREKLGFVGAFIQPEKEVILIVVREEEKDKIFDTITKKAHLDKPGQGIAFMNPLDKVVGFFDLNKK